jgi:hypothetical protein
MNPADIAITAYADPVQKKYACHNAAATWLSAVYFHEKAAEYHPKQQARICERLTRFADYFGIRPEYDKIVKRAEDLRGSDQLPDSSYAYVWQGKDGSKERYYPLTNSVQVKAAAEWLFANRDRIPFADRNVIATKILEKAAAFNANPGEELITFIERQVGRGWPDKAELQSALDYRVKLARTEEQRTAITKLAQALQNTPPLALQQPELVKLATTLDMVDYSIGLKGKYTELLQRPEDVIFRQTYTKTAAEHSRLCNLTTGNVYSKTQLAKLAREDMVNLFGPDFASEVCTGFEINPEKLAAVAHTLPRPDAELLEQLLAEAGQYPQQKTASALELDPQALEELAAAYA